MSEHKLRTVFCDKTVAEEAFLTTSFGNLAARDEFAKRCDLARENDTVMGNIPHIADVELTMADEPTPVHEHFDCSCQARRRKVASA